MKNAEHVQCKFEAILCLGARVKGTMLCGIVVCEHKSHSRHSGVTKQY